MFLSRLNDEEKVGFLKLAHHIARSDGDFSKSEQEIINTYCNEMGIDDIKFNGEDFDLIQDVLKTIISEESKKIFLIEIYALIFSDEYFHEKELKIVNQMLDTFELTMSENNICKEWSKAIMALVEQGKNIISL